MSTSPHVSYPLRISSLGAATVEDSTLDEYASIAVYALRTPKGWWEWLPEFGCIDPVGATYPGVLASDAVKRADERISALTSEERSRLDGTVTRVLIKITSQKAGEA